jgi:hypothetical protein
MLQCWPVQRISYYVVGQCRGYRVMLLASAEDIVLCCWSVQRILCYVVGQCRGYCVMSLASAEDIVLCRWPVQRISYYVVSQCRVFSLCICDYSVYRLSLSLLLYSLTFIIIVTTTTIIVIGSTALRGPCTSLPTTYIHIVIYSGMYFLPLPGTLLCTRVDPKFSGLVPPSTQPPTVARTDLATSP